VVVRPSFHDHGHTALARGAERAVGSASPSAITPPALLSSPQTPVRRCESQGFRSPGLRGGRSGARGRRRFRSRRRRPASGIVAKHGKACFSNTFSLWRHVK
jgi:hypothetical protein